jgi:hypothetical protein
MSSMSFARDRLASALTAGRSSASAVIQNVLSTFPTDELRHARETVFTVQPGTARPRGKHTDVISPARPFLRTESRRQLTDFALGQVLERTGVPRAYVRESLGLEKVARPAARGDREYTPAELPRSVARALRG